MPGLQARHPDVVRDQWDWGANGSKRPEDLLPQSHTDVHWICHLHDQPFRWVAMPNRRFSHQRSGCPQCYNFKRGQPP